MLISVWLMVVIVVLFGAVVGVISYDSGRYTGQQQIRDEWDKRKQETGKAEYRLGVTEGEDRMRNRIEEFLRDDWEKHKQKKSVV